jgi:hypothetical protein
MPSTVSLTKPLEKWVTEQAAVRGLKSADAYVQQLLLEEQKRQAVQFLIKKLEEADASGYQEVTDQRWEESKKRVRAHFNTKTPKKVK